MWDPEGRVMLRGKNMVRVQYKLKAEKYKKERFVTVLSLLAGVRTEALRTEPAKP